MSLRTIDCLRVFPFDQLPFIGNSQAPLSLHPTFSESAWKGVECTHSLENPSPHLTGTHMECKRHVNSDAPELSLVIPDLTKPLAGVHRILQTEKLQVIKRTENAIGFEGGESYSIPQDVPTESYEEVVTLKALENAFPDKHLYKDKVIALQYKDAERRLTNWPYMTNEAVMYLVAMDVSHLILNVPSMDRERDGGCTSNHKLFFENPYRLIVESASLSRLPNPGNITIQMGINRQQLLADCTSLTRLEITLTP